MTIYDCIKEAYPTVLEQTRQQDSLFNRLDDLGFVRRNSLGPLIQTGRATYPVAEVSVPMLYTPSDETANVTVEEKRSYANTVLTNAFETHDYLVEAALFTPTPTNGFNSIPTLVTTNGLGKVGRRDAKKDKQWRNVAIDYGKTGLSEAIDQILNIFPARIAICSEDMFAEVMYSTIGEGVEVLSTKAYDGPNVYFAMPHALKLVISKEYFRVLGGLHQEGDSRYFCKLYSAMQLVTNDRARLAVAYRQ